MIGKKSFTKIFSISYKDITDSLIDEVVQSCAGDMAGRFSRDISGAGALEDFLREYLEETLEETS